MKKIKNNEDMNMEINHKTKVIRFSKLNRFLHFCMILCFLSLAITGMTLKFSHTGWAEFLAHFFGGFQSAGNIHRAAGVGLFTIFITHVTNLFQRKKNEFGSWKKLLLGKDSMVPNLQDAQDVIASLKWFLHRGPRPVYGRWTYWEKFDYFAVFWGVFIIGSTGLTLWFPEFFTKFMPGWFLNVATIIHSDEALLAVGFIFTIHFFNTHLRPEKFPMDTVIFTGTIPFEEFLEERGREHAELVAEGKLESLLTEHDEDPTFHKAVKIFGFSAVGLGLAIVVMIIYGLFFS